MSSLNLNTSLNFTKYTLYSFGRKLKKCRLIYKPFIYLSNGAKGGAEVWVYNSQSPLSVDNDIQYIYAVSKLRSLLYAEEKQDS